MAAQTGLGTSPGVPTNLPTVTAQVSTQSNTGVTGATGINSVAQAEQVLAVAGPNYYSPGQQNIGNPAGGGP
jgi:hypothetical protein